MLNPKVSIVMPIYNQEKYLDRSLTSIMQQTYPNIEIVAVNDGSTDSSAKILATYETKDERLLIVNKQNGGLVEAVCEGIKNSTGDVICFLDPDDYVGEDFVEVFIKNIGDNDVVAAGIYVEKGVNEQKIQKPIELQEDAVFFGEDLRVLRNNFFWDEKNARECNVVFFSRCNKAYRRQCLLNILNDYEFSKRVSIGEDTIFNYLVLREAQKYKCIKKSNTYFYCINSMTSMMRTTNLFEVYEKNKNTFQVFQNILNKDGVRTDMAYYLLYLEMENVIGKSCVNWHTYHIINNYLTKDEDYRKARNLIQKSVNKQRRYIESVVYFIKKTRLYYVYKKMRGGTAE